LSQRGSCFAKAAVPLHHHEDAELFVVFTDSPHVVDEHNNPREHGRRSDASCNVLGDRAVGRRDLP